MKKTIIMFSIITCVIFSVSCNKNGCEAIETMEKFNKVASAAASDNIISDDEAVELNALIEELDTFDEKDDALKKELEKEENKAIYNDMGKAFIRLMFCEGADKLKDLQ
jgi:hypothetical protein